MLIYQSIDHCQSYSSYNWLCRRTTQWSWRTTHTLPSPSHHGAGLSCRRSPLSRNKHLRRPFISGELFLSCFYLRGKSLSLTFLFVLLICAGLTEHMHSFQQCSAPHLHCYTNLGAVRETVALQTSATGRCPAKNHSFLPRARQLGSAQGQRAWICDIAGYYCLQTAGCRWVFMDVEEQQQNRTPSFHMCFHSTTHLPKSHCFTAARLTSLFKCKLKKVAGKAHYNSP